MIFLSIQLSPPLERKIHNPDMIMSYEVKCITRDYTTQSTFQKYARRQKTNQQYNQETGVKIIVCVQRFYIILGLSLEI